MANSYFCSQTLDDVMRLAIQAIRLGGKKIAPSKGSCSELIGVVLEITDPRSRISRTETRGKPFSCLGELCWYLAKTNVLEFISYYIPQYEKYAEKSVIYGGYGPRFFNFNGINQVKNVCNLLMKRPASRRAVIQLFDAKDIMDEHKDTPCTCTLQFMVRNNALHVITYMRSNDAFIGLPHDIFCFTMIQEILANTLSVALGTYKHIVGSLHLYDSNRDAAELFLNEGWQSTKMQMPPMPVGDPWPSIKTLLTAEAALRIGMSINDEEIRNLDPYWKDLIRLLQVFRFSKDNDVERIEEILRSISSPTYLPFVEKKLTECKERFNQKNITN